MSHIESKDLNMYCITPPPPKWDLQEYIRLYIQTGDDNYFYWFLHYYEPTLNEKAKFFRNKYSMEEHFADIKQSLVTGLCKALINYDISIAPFLPYAQRYMEREVHNYIRTMRTGYSVQSEFEYARLRKVMDIFNHSGGEFTEETITKGFFTMFELLQNEFWKATTPHTDIECDKLCSYAIPYLDKPISRYYLIDSNGDEMNMDTIINRYREKKQKLSLPDEMRKYLL